MKTQIQRKIQIERQTQILEDRETLYWTVYGAKYGQQKKRGVREGGDEKTIFGGNLKTSKLNYL